MTGGIKLNAAEIQSGSDRVHRAEGLIAQLPKDHDGRNTWLLNYGQGEEAVALRESWETRKGSPLPHWDRWTNSLSLISRVG